MEKEKILEKIDKGEALTIVELSQYYGELKDKVVGKTMPEHILFKDKIVLGDILIKPIGEFIVLNNIENLDPFGVCDYNVGNISVLKCPNYSHAIHIQANGGFENITLEVIDTGLLNDNLTMDLSRMTDDICKYLLVARGYNLYLLSNHRCFNIESPSPKFIDMVNKYSPMTMLRIGKEFYFKPYNLSDCDLMYKNEDTVDPFEERMGMSEEEWELTGRD